MTTDQDCMSTDIEHALLRLWIPGIVTRPISARRKAPHVTL